MGRLREEYDLLYGAKLLVREGEKVETNQTLAEWDPHSLPILSEADGFAEYGDIIEGVSMRTQVDEVTGFSSMVITDSRDKTARPRIVVKGADGEVAMTGEDHPARYFLPADATFTIAEGDPVKAGDVIAKMPRAAAKTKDITGGLPRVVELFEARTPKDLIELHHFVVPFFRRARGKDALEPSPAHPAAFLRVPASLSLLRLLVPLSCRV